jgi:hypothetical protein
MTKKSIITPLAVLACSAAVVPATAQAAKSYCSESGDVCYGVVKDSSPVKLQIVLQAKYFKKYRLCLKGPSGQRDCKSFKIRKLKGGQYGSTVKIAKHFDFLGKAGKYRARYSQGGESLGPAITF